MSRRSGSRGDPDSTPPWVVVTARCSPTASSATSSTHPAPAAPRRTTTRHATGSEERPRSTRTCAGRWRSAPSRCSATPGAARSVWRMPRCTRRGRGVASPSTRGQARARSMRGRRRRRNGRPALRATPTSPGGLPRRVRSKPACLPTSWMRTIPRRRGTPPGRCTSRIRRGLWPSSTSPGSVATCASAASRRSTETRPVTRTTCSDCFRGSPRPRWSSPASFDFICGPSQAREIAARIPGCELVVLPDCGHIPAYEKPQEFRELVFGWCDSRD